eukprot:360252-Chlamydomonas_euryale.AAC.9
MKNSDSTVSVAASVSGPPQAPHDGDPGGAGRIATRGDTPPTKKNMLQGVHVDAEREQFAWMEGKGFTHSHLLLLDGVYIPQAGYSLGSLDSPGQLQPRQPRPATAQTA